MITLGTSSLGIGLAIHLRDRFSAKAMAISRTMNNLHGNAQRVQQQNLRAMQAIGAGMAVSGALMTRGFVRSYKEYANFQHIVTNTAAVLGLVNKEMREFSALSLDLGKSSVFSPEQVASAGEFLARQGFNFRQLKQTLPAVIQLGAATNKAIEGKLGAADIMASMMHQFNIGADPKQVRRLADVLTKTTLISASDMEDIFEATKQFSSTAMDLNLGLEESLSMIATLSNAGLRGGMGGRSLNNLFLYLGSAVTRFRTTRQMEAFQAIGIGIEDIIDSSGKLKPVIDLIQLFQDKLRGMSDVERAGATRALFNIRGARAMGPLVRASELGLDFAEVLRQIRTESDGVAAAIASKRMSDSWGLLEKLKDTVKAFRIEIGQSLKPVFDFIVKGLTWFFNAATEFVSHPLGRPFVILAAAGGAALLVGGALLAAFASLRLLTLVSTVSFANMGRTLAMAWNTGTAAALRYATTARGATLVSTPFGPRWRGAGGRFVKGPTGTSFFGMGGLGKSMFNLIKGSTVLTGLFRGLGIVVRAVTGPIGWFAGILGMVMGFRNMIKLLVFGLGTLLNAVVLAGQMLWHWVTNPVGTLTGNNPGATAAIDRFKRAQDNMMEQFGMKKMDKTVIGTPLPDRSTVGLQERLDAINALQKTQKRDIKINLDGRTVGQMTEAQKVAELQSLFNAVPSN